MNLEQANKYWEEKEEHIWRVACENGLEDALEGSEGFMNFNELLFELFDNGDHEPTYDEILTAIIEYLN